MQDKWDGDGSSEYTLYRPCVPACVATVDQRFLPHLSMGMSKTFETESNWTKNIGPQNNLFKAQRVEFHHTLDRAQGPSAQIYRIQPPRTRTTKIAHKDPRTMRQFHVGNHFKRSKAGTNRRRRSPDAKGFFYATSWDREW